MHFSGNRAVLPFFILLLFMGPALMLILIPASDGGPAEVSGTIASGSNGNGSDGNGSDGSGSDGTSGSASRGEPEDIAAWSVFVYMAGDNNLEPAAVDDFNEMERVGSSDEVNIIVQIDRASGWDRTNGDWQDTRRYRIEKDMDKDTMNSTRLDSGLGELKMNTPEPLRDFLLWGLEEYPAEKYMVIIWDHGLGWNGGVCKDQNGYMSISDLRKAFSQVKEQWNHTFDIIGFDACLMGGIETYYQLQGFANYSFGSEKNEPTDGLPYNDFLWDLVQDPGIPIEELLDVISHDYVKSYTGISPISVQHSGINLTRFEDLTTQLNDYVTELEIQLPYYLNEVKDAWNLTEEYERGHDYNYFDLLDFLQQLSLKVKNGRFDIVSELLMNTINESIVSHYAWNTEDSVTDTVLNSTGMTVYFPDPHGDLTTPPLMDKYKTTQFAIDTLWDEFLQLLFNYNDPDYLESKDPTASLITEFSLADGDQDGDIDTFELEYQVISVKGDDIGNVTVELVVTNSSAVQISRNVHDTGANSGNMSIDFEQYGFDKYYFTVYLYDENGTLQNVSSFDHDFQKYGVTLELFIDDGTGNLTEPGEVELLPGGNVSYMLIITNTGNSWKHFRIQDSGVPYKYDLSFEENDIAIGPDSQKFLPLLITVYDVVFPGTDTFQMIVRCVENESVSDSVSIRITVLEPEETDEDGATPFNIYIITIISALVIIFTLGAFFTKRSDPSVPGEARFPTNPYQNRTSLQEDPPPQGILHSQLTKRMIESRAIPQYSKIPTEFDTTTTRTIGQKLISSVTLPPPPSDRSLETEKTNMKSPITGQYLPIQEQNEQPPTISVRPGSLLSSQPQRTPQEEIREEES